MNIPTALEILQKHLHDPNGKPTALTDAMIEFAKLHVEAALKEASISKSLCTVYTSDGLDYKENRLCKESVENAYPLGNIK
jgi:hypothetical protein